ncbi:MAG: SIMPL domain-containing protein [Myxococcota bacterium]
MFRTARAVWPGLLALSASTLLALPASAQKWLQPPKDQVSFRVEATRDVPNDWVIATLGVDEEGNDAAALAVRVNRRMGEALALAKEDQQIEVSSGAYQTQPVYDRGKLVRWRARQDLVVEGESVDRITSLVGKLQAQGLLLRGVSFSVSPEMRSRLEDELIVEALSLFRQRAGLVARGIGRRGWNLMSLSIGQQRPPVPHFQQGRTMALEASAATPPALESGKSTLRVSIDATIEVE